MTARPWRGRVFIGTSLDGYIAREDGSIGWLTDPPVRTHHVAASGERPALVWETFEPTVDTIVMGRATYDTVLSFGEWPFGGKRVLVLTTRDDLADPRVVPVATVDDAVRRLTEFGAKEVYLDGGRTIQSFLRAGLVDEITVSVAPVILGAGRSLFGALDADVLLTLRGSHATVDGLVRSTYNVVRPG